MKFKFWFIAIVFLLSASSIFSQHYNCRYLIPFREKKLWGFSDTLGITRIKPAYDSVSFFTFLDNDYYATIFKENKRSLLTTSGELVFPFVDSLVRLSDEYFYARDTNKYGVYHLRRKLLVPLLYDTFLSTKNYPLYNQKYYRIIGRKENKYYLINYINNEVEEIAKPEAAAPKTTLIAPGTTETMYSVVAVPDAANTLTSIPASELFFRPGKQLSILKQNKKNGVVNEKGELLIPCKYDSILIISNNTFITVKKKKYGVIYLNSIYKDIPNQYTKLEYDRSLPVTKNWSFLLFKVVKNNKAGYVGENGVEYFTE